MLVVYDVRHQASPKQRENSCASALIPGLEPRCPVCRKACQSGPRTYATALDVALILGESDASVIGLTFL